MLDVMHVAIVVLLMPVWNRIIVLDDMMSGGGVSLVFVAYVVHSISYRCKKGAPTVHCRN